MSKSVSQSQSNRRVFVLQLVTGAGAGAVAGMAGMAGMASSAHAAKDAPKEAAKTPATAAAPSPVSDNSVRETDPQAQGMGYVADASKVDPKKFPKKTAEQSCSTCALFGGKAGAALGSCPIFQGKQVAAKGWCSAYTKKA